MLTRRDFVVRTMGAVTAAAVLSGIELPFGGTLAAYAYPLPIPDNAPWQARHNLSTTDYQAAFDQLGSQGYRLVDISGYELDGSPHYAAIWVQMNGPAWVAHHGLSPDDHQALFNTLPAQGFRPIHVSAYTVAGSLLFASIWLQDATATQAHHGLSADDYQAMFNQLGAQGFRLIDISGYEDNGQARYAAIWDQSSGPAWQAHHGLSADDYQTLFQQLTSQGWRPIRVSGYGVAGTDYYASIWLQAGGPALGARHGVVSSDWQDAFDEWVYQGFRPMQISGYTGRGATRLAGIFENHGLSDADLSTINGLISGFMSKYNVPGMSLAITRGERLVYARGVGSLDDAGTRPTHVRSVFRVASVTKPITSTTIFKLIEQNQLKLSDTVFGTKGILGTTYGTTPYGTNIEKITVQHLLEHTAGGWKNDNNDPMFQHTDYDQTKLIGWVLDNRPLDNAPGTTYAYSNFGYCVLGRVIEKVSGQSYEAYVLANTLGPSGVTNMHIAGNMLADARPDEAQYYDTGGQDPYAMNVTRMDSHGGWLASAVDLTRFAVGVDGFPNKPDIVSASSLTSMTTPSAANAAWGKGWGLFNQGTQHNWFWNGLLPGTGAWIARYSSGFCHGVIINRSDYTSDTSRGAVVNDLDQMMRDIESKVTSWPTYDLF